ncbi:hypothetical protein JW710_02275 [Candidatus Dojkabacteria bacterium]|nr:hypothetical protein [Candidatus Dojkabacteria bacterium]
MKNIVAKIKETFSKAFVSGNIAMSAVVFAKDNGTVSGATDDDTKNFFERLIEGGRLTYGLVCCLVLLIVLILVLAALSAKKKQEEGVS